MNNLEELTTLINNRTLDIEGYNETLLKDLVVSYAIYHDILVDTREWDELIDYLWNNLYKNWLEYSFLFKEQFDNYMATDLT